MFYGLSDDENVEITPIPPEQYKLVIWSNHEKMLRERVFRDKSISDKKIPFSVALELKLRKSVFGLYLESFNSKQEQSISLNQNKLAITNDYVKRLGDLDLEKFNNDNNMLDDFVVFLTDSVNNWDGIDFTLIHEKALMLRLCFRFVTTIDNQLSKFKNLQDLILTGNRISDLSGSVLPRNLKVLELYLNEIKDLRNLCKKAPKSLQHLGLARNPLTNDSKFDLLANSGNFKQLKSLDLGECDIYRVVDVLIELKLLQELECLSLIGNPCSSVMSYRDAVLCHLPHLYILDGIMIPIEHRAVSPTFLETINKAYLTFTCLKLMKVPKPPKAEKSVKQTFHIELKVPLFQDVCTSSRKGIIPAKQNSINENIFLRENEFNEETEKVACTTSRLAWKSNLSFPPLTLETNNLIAYRDTFRSKVQVCIVYLKVQVPKASKKDKKKKAGKKDKKDKKAKNKLDEVMTKEETHPETPKEIILKKITVARFHCDLHSVPWSNSRLEFNWIQNPEFGNTGKEKKLYKFIWEEEPNTENKESGDEVKPKTKGKKVKKQKPPKASKFLSCDVSFALTRVIPNNSKTSTKESKIMELKDSKV